MIEIRNIEDIALLRESEELECKKAAGRDGQGELPSDFWPSYAAMANTDGGMVLLGVKEKNGKFELHGIANPDRVRKDLVDLLQNREKVSVNLLTKDRIEEIEIDGKIILQISIPRATREQKPVFLNGNPLNGNCYRRFHEADQKMSDEEVKALLAEQMQDSLDARILPTFGLDDLDPESLRFYRQSHATLNPGHPWTGLTDMGFLRAIGAWGENRETGEKGLTIGGLLMFGTFQGIQEIYPYYLLDYQERAEAKTENRWIDRVTLDGTWSGNLYDFYRKVYPKLTADLKVPFALVDGVRQDDTPVHVALREALANVLVHSDYREPARMLVVKRPDMFGFQNPGLMRVPLAIALEGGEPDCRNRKLHAMFRYINIGEQAGTGIPKILAGWESQHWRQPHLREAREPSNRTILELQMLDLFPPGVFNILRKVFGERFESLSQEGRLALAITLTEGRLTHARLYELTTLHPADLSKILSDLVSDGILTSVGSGRGAVYRFVGTVSIGPDDVLGPGSSPENGMSSPDLGLSSPDLSLSSPDLNLSSPDLNLSSPDKARNEDGLLISVHFEHHGLCFIDVLNQLSPGKLAELEAVAALPREKKKIQREKMIEVIMEVCTGHFITLGALAELVKRNPDALRDSYLTPLRKEHRVRLAFPDTPNDERQAYTVAN